jgi:hypothetical protein
MANQPDECKSSRLISFFIKAHLFSTSASTWPTYYDLPDLDYSLLFNEFFGSYDGFNLGQGKYDC